MERLTQKFSDMETGNIRAYHLKTNAPCEVSKAIKKLGQYEDLEERGLLMKLPCKVGDTVYRINKGAKDQVIPMEVREISIFQCKNKLVSQIKCRDYAYCGEMCYLTDDLGKTIFLTQDKAVQALRQQD